MTFRLSFLVAGLLIVAGCTGTQPQPSTDAPEPPITETDSLLHYQDQVTTDFLREHLTVFASDSMEGRETGTRGEDMAAQYLAEQYSQMGLAPAGDSSSYFQKFKLNVSTNDSIVFRTFAQRDGVKNLLDQSTASANTTANYIRAFGGSDTLSGDIIFAGFGLNDAARNVTHLGNTDLEGKWVLIFGEIPHIVQGDTLINPELDEQARFKTIIGRGAEGILVIPDLNSEEFNESAKQAQRGYGDSGRMSLAYRDEDSRGFAKGYNVINPELAATMLDTDSLAAYRQNLIANITNFRPQELDYSLTQIPYSSSSTIESQNVLAFFEGADPKLKDEVVVMTSHYDHVGIGEPDSTGDRIYNGADDDGSGTIGLLNIAKAFAAAGKNGIKPKRSILFLNVSAEEKGLLGSRYYSDHPAFPMDKTIANINTDMIGRIDSLHESKGTEEYTYIIGAEIISSQLDNLINLANDKSGRLTLNKRYNDLQDPNQFYRRSDHWHFGRKGVPFAFFFTGVHEDYHRPSDEVHKIRFEKMAKIVRTMYASAVLLANTENPPKVDNQEFIEITKGDF